jgi:hypothetical protein
LWRRALAARTSSRSCRFDWRGVGGLQVPRRLHRRNGVQDHAFMAPRRQAGKGEVAGQRHLVGNHEIPPARDPVRDAVASEAETAAGFDEVDHGRFLIGEGDALRQRAERAEDIVQPPPVCRAGRRCQPRQTGEVGPVLAENPVAGNPVGAAST